MNILGYAQKLGKALMLPIAVLPVAGLLLRFGQPDLLDLAFIAEAGQVIFSNLPLLFALGVAAGLSHDNSSAAAIAGGVGYLIMTAALKSLDESLNPDALGGIIMGITAGHLYNRFHNIKLPEFLGFFGGKRFVPIVTGLAALVVALLLSVIWPGVQSAIGAMGDWLLESGPAGAFTYGFANRLLIPFGLHHIINSIVWTVFGEYNGVTGELARFWAEDPTAGYILSGFFPVMMFGLPAGAYAMYLAAKKENRANVSGMLISVALTAMLTGITEPLEYLFMFLAPVLFVLHAILMGISVMIAQMLEVRLVFSFSAGLIDYLLNFNAPNANNAWILLPMGLAFAAVYFVVFSVAIRMMNLPTPGREEEVSQIKTGGEAELPDELAGAYLDALGGKANLTTIDACITRLRLTVKDMDRVDEIRVKALGAKGVVKVGSNNLQVILGPQAEQISTEMKLI